MNSRIVLTTIYSINKVTRARSRELEIRMNELILSISSKALVDEVLRIEQHEVALVQSWEQTLKQEFQPAHFVAHTVIAIVRISAKSTKIAGVFARAHQRLVLERAHLLDLDIAIDA